MCMIEPHAGSNYAEQRLNQYTVKQHRRSYNDEKWQMILRIRFVILLTRLPYLEEAANSSAVRPDPSGATVIDRNRFPASEGLPRSSILYPKYPELNSGSTYIQWAHALSILILSSQFN